MTWGAGDSRRPLPRKPCTHVYPFHSLLQAAVYPQGPEFEPTPACTSPSVHVGHMPATFAFPACMHPRSHVPKLPRRPHADCNFCVPKLHARAPVATYTQGPVQGRTAPKLQSDQFVCLHSWHRLRRAKKCPNISFHNVWPQFSGFGTTFLLVENFCVTCYETVLLYTGFRSETALCKRFRNTKKYYFLVRNRVI